MRALMVSAMHSGAGKTVLVCALMRALQRQGLLVAGFKCGPDYLDPLFHQRVLGMPSDNLDLFLQGDKGVRQTLALAGPMADVGIVEGAMGFYDGVGGTHEASAWELASRMGIPVVLAVRPAGSSLTLAAQLRGVMAFREPSQISGVVLVDCKPALAAHLTPIIERTCDIPVLGYLPPMEEASFASRHLGLVTAAEVPDFQRRIDAMATTLSRTCDLNALVALCGDIEEPTAAAVGPAPAGAARAGTDEATGLAAPDQTTPTCRIAVASDEAFCFYYPAALARLRACGAQLVRFSPLRDADLPSADALYLGGGYPELHATRLAANRGMRRSVQEAVLSGMPTVAECGGFMYLQQELVDERGTAHRMAAALPGSSAPAGRLVRFGYARLAAEDDSLLLRAGERVPAHEFHHWDGTHNGQDLVAHKPSGRSWRCCHASPSLYAGYPHLHLAGELPLAERLVACATTYGRHQE